MLRAPALTLPRKPVSEFWYGLRPVENDIVCIREIHIDPYSAGDSWLMKGSATDVIIDTGSGILPLAPIVSSISTNPVLAVALNHSYDHAGGWSGFEARACHPLDAPALLDPSRELTQVSKYLDDSRLTALPWPGYSTVSYHMAGAAPTQLLDDGDQIDLGNRLLEVMHVPGRSPGGIALWEAETGCLFPSDMLYDGPHGLAWPPEDPVLYAESLRRFRSLPVTVVHGGHYGSFERERMLEIIDQQLLDLSQ